MKSARNIISLLESNARFVTDVRFETDVAIEVLDKVNIEWSIEFEYRKWGVKSAYIDVPNQSFIVTVDTSTKEQEMKFDAENIEVQYDLLSFPIAPKRLTYFNNKWVIEF